MNPIVAVASTMHHFIDTKYVNTHIQTFCCFQYVLIVYVYEFAVVHRRCPTHGDSMREGENLTRFAPDFVLFVVDGAKTRRRETRQQRVEVERLRAVRRELGRERVVLRRSRLRRGALGQRARVVLARTGDLHDTNVTKHTRRRPVPGLRPTNGGEARRQV